jgi:hypothetical protein
MKCKYCNGNGYLLEDNDEYGVRIEKCDACERFASDAEASEHVFNLASTCKELVAALEHAYERLNAIPHRYKDTDFQQIRTALARAREV